jgi:hypothetical protein
MVNHRVVRFALRSWRLPTGYAAVQAAIQLEVRNRYHDFKALDFIVDSGATVTTLPASVAQENLISFPEKSMALSINTAMGQERLPVHAGPITARIPDLENRDFIWPCHFVEFQRDQPAGLLGLGGVLNDLRIYFDGTYALEAPYGWVVLEEVGTASEP